ncbi:MAG: hypothetical protein INQ03_24525 [Candidatus Heimdallarchaeota archaeon]|nr:hypothetical protein [Candidatus Heimdallarchaeota archaeon]
MHKPAIIIVAFNRSDSLLRLLSSVSNAVYPEDVTLIISIDKGDNQDVIEVANNFEWNKGVKEVICHEVNLGVRKHILSCGDLTSRYGSVIVLEDDLVVSPMFYQYATQAANYYDKEERIAGISLYSIQVNIWQKLPFTPLIDESDVFFLQMPESWGQLWTSDQWNTFKKWYADHNLNLNELHVPNSIKRWKDTAWSKLFVEYMVRNDLYFVYPRESLSTNYGDAGAHFKNQTNVWQVQLQTKKSTYVFSKFEESESKYDIYFELIPDIIKNRNKMLSEYSFDVDLYGAKSADDLKHEYILTSQECSEKIAGFARILRPMIENVFQNIEGEDIVFCKSEHVKKSATIYPILFYYFYGYQRTLKLLNMIKFNFLRKF